MAALTETKTPPVLLGRTFCFGDESDGKLLPSRSDCGPGAVQKQYKSRPCSSLSHPLRSHPSPWEQGKSEALCPFSDLRPPPHPLGFLNTSLSLGPTFWFGSACGGSGEAAEVVAWKEAGLG